MVALKGSRSNPSDAEDQGDEPLVTIGLAVFNGGRFLREALESLAAQTYKNIEILIGDNASTDSTESICREYVQADSRIRYLRSPENRGAAWNFNRLVHAAEGKYFRWAAADDVLRPHFIEQALAILNHRADVVLVYPKTLLIDADGRPLGEYEDDLHLPFDRPSDRFRALRRRIGLNNVFYGLMRRSTLRRTRLLGVQPRAGTEFVSELSLYGKFVELPGRHFCRRLHDGAASQKHGDEMTGHYGKPTNQSAGRLDGPDHRLANWRRMASTFGAIRRCPMGVGEKARVSWFAFRELVRARDQYVKELGCALRFWVRSAAFWLPRTGSGSSAKLEKEGHHGPTSTA